MILIEQPEFRSVVSDLQLGTLKARGFELSGRAMRRLDGLPTNLRR